MIAYAKFYGFLNVGYLLNRLSILYVDFENLVPFWRNLFGQDDW